MAYHTVMDQDVKYAMVNIVSALFQCSMFAVGLNVVYVNTCSKISENRSLGMFVAMFILVTTQWRADYVWWFGAVTMASLVVQETIISKELLIRHYIIIMLYLQ